MICDQIELFAGAVLCSETSPIPSLPHLYQVHKARIAAALLFFLPSTMDSSSDSDSAVVSLPQQELQASTVSTNKLPFLISRAAMHRDTRFYHEDGDCIFMVETTLFKVREKSGTFPQLNSIAFFRFINFFFDATAQLSANYSVYLKKAVRPVQLKEPATNRRLYWKETLSKGSGPSVGPYICRAYML